MLASRAEAIDHPGDPTYGWTSKKGSKELTDGTHEIALSDITSQTIAVIAHNNANGVNRNMNQSTIEEMTVTISGGEVTEMIICGRVQTNGGTLDRYTATINQ